MSGHGFDLQYSRVHIRSNTQIHYRSKFIMNPFRIHYEFVNPHIREAAIEVPNSYLNIFVYSIKFLYIINENVQLCVW